MRFKKVALLTLAALASQNLAGVAKSFANSPTPSSDTPPTDYKADGASDAAPIPIPSVSAPETLTHEQFAAGNLAGDASQGWLAAAGGPEFSVAAKPIAIATAVSSQDAIATALKETWLAKMLEFSADRSPQVRDAVDAIALRTNTNPQSDGAFNNTVTLLNALLIVSTLLPAVTIAFFWLVRRLVVKELIADANKRIKGIGALENEIKNYSELSQKLKEELEAQMRAAKQSVEFITREAELSKSSIDQIETLKSQFLLHLQVLLTEVYQTKSQTVQELAQIPAVTRQEVAIPQAQLEGGNSKPLKLVPLEKPKPQETLIADDYVKQGEALYLEGRYEEALIGFEKAILMNADIDRAWYHRGNVLVKVQRLEEAIACYDQAIGLNRDNYEAWYNRGNTLMKLQRYEEAVAAYDQAIALKPEDYGAWHNRAASMGRLQRYEEAIASYNRALAIKSDDSEVWHTRGAMLGKLQRYEEAVASYDEALAIKQDRYETWYNRGNILWRLLRYSDAIASYDKAIAVNPDKYEVWYNRGAVLGKLQRYSEAIASYDKAIGIQPDDHEIWHNRAVALGRLSQHAEAIASYEQAIVIQPQCYEAWFGKGEALAKLQEYESAIAAYDRAIAIKPDSYDAWRHRGTALSELKQYEEAMVCYDKAIAIKPDNAEAWRDRGALLSELKQDSEAVASLSQAISIQQNLGRNSANG